MVYFIEKHLFKILFWIVVIYFIFNLNSNNNISDNIVIADKKIEIEDNTWIYNFSKSINYVNDSIDINENISSWKLDLVETQEAFKYYKVSEIIDWDTIKVLNNNELITIRLLWIDAPEITTLRKWYIECFWNESKLYLYNILNWKDVYLELDDSQWEYDKYWRLLAYVFLKNININELMIKDGYAYEYTYNLPYKYQEDFKNAQNYASENELGLWSKDTCSDEKDSVPTEKTSITISNDLKNCIIKWNISYKTHEKIYHVPWCDNYDDVVINTSYWERWFCSEQEAINAWWRKAYNCP